MGLDYHPRPPTLCFTAEPPRRVQPLCRELEGVEDTSHLAGHRYRSKKSVFNKSPTRPMEHPSIPIFPVHKEPHA